MKDEKDTQQDIIEEATEYKYGFTTDIATETIPRGLSEEVVGSFLGRKGNRTGCLNLDYRHTADGWE